jgi:hypothetical protein
VPTNGALMPLKRKLVAKRAAMATLGRWCLSLYRLYM